MIHSCIRRVRGDIRRTTAAANGQYGTSTLSRYQMPASATHMPNTTGIPLPVPCWFRAIAAAVINIPPFHGLLSAAHILPSLDAERQTGKPLRIKRTASAADRISFPRLSGRLGAENPVGGTTARDMIGMYLQSGVGS